MSRYRKAYAATTAWLVGFATAVVTSSASSVTDQEWLMLGTGAVAVGAVWLFPNEPSA